MTVRLFNTATRAVEDFVPVRDGHVGIYVCGATVQGSPHIGHMRSAIAFDVLHRWLARSGWKVTLVRNVTDVGDTIFERAAAQGIEWWELAQIHEREFTDAYSALGVLSPARVPRATGHIPEIVELISELVSAGHAYESEGSVYFDVRSFDRYGALTNQALEDMESDNDSVGTRRDPRDFALWKAAKNSDPATALWNTPWGRGRPGWHIECSAMAQKYLGETFDIHGGGLDLRFPHHENEQAQSHAAGYPFAKLWMHSAWVTQAGEKMSKSLGNTMAVSNVLAQHSAPAVRLALAGVHYRSMIEYSEATLVDAEATWGRIDGFVRRAFSHVGGPAAESLEAVELPSEFVEAMNDDLAVPRALAHVHDAIREGNAAITEGDDKTVRTRLAQVRAMLDVLGLDPLDPLWASHGDAGDSQYRTALEAVVQPMLDARAAARDAKDWERADEIRDELAAAGIAVKDGADGQTWSLASEA